MTKVFIAGVGMTHFGNHQDRTLKDLVREAVTGALTDAGILLEDIQGAYFGTACQGIMENQHMIPGQVALGAMGLRGIPVVNVENACATGSTALHMAINHIKSGTADIVLAVGADKICSSDKAKSFSVFDAGWDVEHPATNIADLLDGYFDQKDISGDGRKRSVFMDIYYGMAKHHMDKYGTSARQLAVVAAKNHFHSTMNPKSQFQKNMTVEDVLAAPKVVGPLTIPMCAPISDGAAAALVMSEKAAQRLERKCIEVLANSMRSNSKRDARNYHQHLTHLAANEAYNEAGIGPKDISVAEVHDAAAFGEIIQSECLGFAPFGEGGALAESGATTLGGSIPINTSGGLESKGHPIGATGLGQIYELVTQLRGEAGKRQVDNARFAIAENGGGIYGVEEATCCITILGKG